MTAALPHCSRRMIQGMSRATVTTSLVNVTLTHAAPTTEGPSARPTKASSAKCGTTRGQQSIRGQGLTTTSAAIITAATRAGHCAVRGRGVGRHIAERRSSSWGGRGASVRLATRAQAVVRWLRSRSWYPRRRPSRQLSPLSRRWLRCCCSACWLSCTRRCSVRRPCTANCSSRLLRARSWAPLRPTNRTFRRRSRSGRAARRLPGSCALSPSPRRNRKARRKEKAD
mmetsp:Transcript_72121/g.216812  ORF Transcript_72121/g.216812 Transcript_72121/m.216812 type:complete len:227 (-) Transcript_72121:184-864(-)